MTNAESLQRVVYLSRNDGTDTRISKECNSLHAAGYQIDLIGWDRTPGRQKSNPMPQIDKHIITSVAKFGILNGPINLIRFYWHVITVINHARPNVVHAVNEDLTILLLPLKPMFGFKVVCDLFDSLYLKFSSANILARAIISFGSKLCWRFSDIVLVTDEERKKLLAFTGEKFRVVPNYPVGPGDSDVKALPELSQRRYLFVAGTLYEARGLAQIRALMDSIENVYVICAGWLYDELAEAFVKHPKVDYLGILTPQAALAYAAQCDLVVALYDPVNDNMRYASPNKIYDAMCVGVPVLINSETIISRWVVDTGVGFATPYSDVDGMHAVVGQLPRGEQEKALQARHIQAIFQQGYSWSVAEKVLLDSYGLLR